MATRFSSAVLCGALALIAPAARAQSQPGASAPAQLAPRERDELSRAHFRAGARYFELRQYPEAATEFERVFELTGQSTLLYNAARAWEAAGRARSAVSAYQRFLASGAQGVDRATIERSIAALAARAEEEDRERARTEACQNTAAPQTLSTTTTASAATPAAPIAPVDAGPLLQLRTRVRFEHSSANMVGPWVLLGGGAVVGALALWQGVSSITDAARVREATTWSPQLTSSYYGVREQGNTSIILGATAGAVLVGGVVWLIARGPGERREEVLRTAMIIPTAGGATVTLGGVL